MSVFAWPLSTDRLIRVINEFYGVAGKSAAGGPCDGAWGYTNGDDGCVSKSGGGTCHRALDMQHDGGGSQDDDILAAAGGVAHVYENSSGGCGKYVEIDHTVGEHGYQGTRNARTKYCHLSLISVTDGQIVQQGDVIGKMGATGDAGGVHLHFALYIDDEVTDPCPYLPAPASGVKYVTWGELKYVGSNQCTTCTDPVSGHTVVVSGECDGCGTNLSTGLPTPLHHDVAEEGGPRIITPSASNPLMRIAALVKKTAYQTTTIQSTTCFRNPSDILIPNGSQAASYTNAIDRNSNTLTFVHEVVPGTKAVLLTVSAWDEAFNSVIYPPSIDYIKIDGATAPYKVAMERSRRDEGQEHGVGVYLIKDPPWGQHTITVRFPYTFEELLGNALNLNVTDANEINLGTSPPPYILPGNPTDWIFWPMAAFPAQTQLWSPDPDNGLLFTVTRRTPYYYEVLDSCWTTCYETWCGGGSCTEPDYADCLHTCQNTYDPDTNQAKAVLTSMLTRPGIFYDSWGAALDPASQEIYGSPMTVPTMPILLSGGKACQSSEIIISEPVLPDFNYIQAKSPQPAVVANEAGQPECHIALDRYNLLYRTARIYIGRQTFTDEYHAVFRDREIRNLGYPSLLTACPYTPPCLPGHTLQNGICVPCACPSVEIIERIFYVPNSWFIGSDVIDTLNVLRYMIESHSG